MQNVSNTHGKARVGRSRFGEHARARKLFLEHLENPVAFCDHVAVELMQPPSEHGRCEFASWSRSYVCSKSTGRLLGDDDLR